MRRDEGKFRVLGPAEFDDTFEHRGIARRAADRGMPFGVDERPAGTAVGEDERELARVQLRVDRHHDEPRPPASEQGLDVFRHVARDERHTIPGEKSRSGERARHARGIRGKRRVVMHDAVGERDGRQVRPAASRARE